MLLGVEPNPGGWGDSQAHPQRDGGPDHPVGGWWSGLLGGGEVRMNFRWRGLSRGSEGTSKLGCYRLQSRVLSSRELRWVRRKWGWSREKRQLKRRWLPPWASSRFLTSFYEPAGQGKKVTGHSLGGRAERTWGLEKPLGFCVCLGITSDWSEKGLPSLGNLFKKWFGWILFFPVIWKIMKR